MSTEEKVVTIPVISKTLGYKTQIRFDYTWVIDDFCWDSAEYSSPIFSSGCNEKIKWFLKIRRYNSYRNFYLCLLPCKVSELSVSYTVSLVDEDDKKALTSRGMGRTVSTTDVITEYQSDRGFKVDSIVNHTTELLLDDELTILCEIDLYINTPIISVSRGTIKEPKCQLRGNIAGLFKNPDFSDVTIKVGKLEFPAHKAILSVRSSVFAAMFKHEMAEKLQNRVEITDIEPEVFKEMLWYIYTGKVPLIEIMADKLLMAAEKYELERLKVICEKKLSIQLTSENATDTLILADLHNADQLKSNTLDFIALNVAEVMETTSFKAMVKSHPYLSLIAGALRVLGIRNPEADEHLHLHG